ncbi:Fic family protein [Photobacterium damselae]|uniref:Fic family protein n=1 Tax=Photobacterium damselae TaxID=38293 RepID=UPI0010FE65DC|nr:Fic family protein [Photobacterium damselae]TLS77483.1 hypothetical protein FD721_11515 [Photobacterium damselae subsp. damselae]TLS83253.1 hypothetical protein FD720_20060 [Photobacterium damselae subsp. damselae]
MAFDPLTWGLGFGMTKMANTLIERTYPNDLPVRLRGAAKKWADELPIGVQTPIESIFNIQEDVEFSGSARSRLQAILYMHTSIPSEDVWFDALIETWYEKKQKLGDEGNAFFTQDKNSSQKYIRKLAKSLYRECQKDSALFQVTALTHLANLADKSKDLKQEMFKTRSMMIDRFNRIEEFQMNYVKPVKLNEFLSSTVHTTNWNNLCDLNKILMVDKPTSVIAGRLRDGQSWIGSHGASLEQAVYVPPVGRDLKVGLSSFLAKWGKENTALTSRDPKEIVSGIAEFHYELLAVHPFEDGNGSVARAISDSHAREFFAHNDRLGLLDTESYMSALQSANNGNLDPLIKTIDSAIFD